MNIKVLLCSPRGTTGGICQWTENILSYASAVQSDEIVLDWFYADISKGTSGKTFIRRIYSGIRNYLPFIKELHGVLKNNSYDVVHFSTSGGISFVRDLLALKECKRRKIRTALHFHFGKMPQVLKSRSFERKMFDLCLPFIDSFVAIDRKTYEALIDYGCKNVHYLPNPLSPGIEALIKKAEDEREPNLVVFVGHVLRTKGVFELVTACRDISDIKLELLGLCKDEVKDELIKTAGADSARWLTIRGNCTMPEVISAMKRCSIFVLPSYTEGFPNVIIEAMACACPIIATPVGAIPEMLDSEGSKCGVLVPMKDIASLRNAINNLKENTNRDIMGANAQRRVRRLYSMNKVWNQLNTIWLSCCQS